MTTAGKMPHARAASTPIPRPNAVSMGVRRVTSLRRGTVSGATAVRIGTHQNARRTAAAIPATTTAAPSATDCRIRRHRSAPECDLNRQLTTLRRLSGEEQSDHIRAGQQQHNCGGGHEQEQRRTCLSEDVIGERRHDAGPAGSGPARPSQAIDDSVHVGLRLGQADAGSQASVDVQNPEISGRQHVVALCNRETRERGRDRQPQCGSAWIVEFRRPSRRRSSPQMAPHRRPSSPSGRLRPGPPGTDFATFRR